MNGTVPMKVALTSPYPPL